MVTVSCFYYTVSHDLISKMIRMYIYCQLVSNTNLPVQYVLKKHSVKDDTVSISSLCEKTLGYTFIVSHLEFYIKLYVLQETL